MSWETKLHSTLRKNHPDLAAQLDTLKNEAIEIWKQPRYRTLTAHGESHFRQVSENIDALTNSLQSSSNPLSGEEIFTLLAACYFHDIGMQTGQTDAREQHAQLAYELIMNSFDSDAGKKGISVNLSIQDPNARETIALLSRAHWAEFATQLPTEEFIHGNKKGRLRLLGCVLALADLLDISPVRASYYRTRHRLYELNSIGTLHQTRHQLVRGFHIHSPDPKHPGELQYVIEWRDDSKETKKLHEWTLLELDAYWSKLTPHIIRESHGTIFWTEPWIKPIFHKPLASIPKLTKDAARLLDEELNTPPSEIATADSLEISEETLTNDDANLEHLEPPNFEGQIPRPHLSELLDREAANHNTVTVEGLSGSGKSFLVANSIARWRQKRLYKEIFWYDTQEEETLDEMLTALGALGFDGNSIKARCKSLIRLLQDHHSLLVIDDFHRLTQSTTRPLLEAATETQGDYRARVLIISRTVTDAVRSTASIGHLEVRGFSADEISDFLSRRGLTQQNDHVLRKLAKTTGGLPLAISIFSTLVVRFGRDPESLISGDMMRAVRLREWFVEILHLIGVEATGLLATLSVWDGPFNSGVVRLAGKLSLAEDPIIVFEYLERCYLVHPYTLYRSSLHALVADMAINELEAPRRRKIEHAFGQHASRGIVLRPSAIYEDHDLTWLIRACAHFQRASAASKAQKILHAISKTAKVRGHYETFIRLADKQEAGKTRKSRWIAYHCAHCKFLLGRFQEALIECEFLVNEATSESSWNELLNYQRLRAEVLTSLGHPEEALELVRESLQAAPRSKTNVADLNHSISVESWILTHLGRVEEAAEKASWCLSDSQQRADWLGEGINLTRLAVTSIESGELESAENLLSEAFTLFEGNGLRRAAAWVLHEAARCQARMGHLEQAHSALSAALDLTVDLAEYSMDYCRSLRELALFPELVRRDPRILTEFSRLSTVYSSTLST